MKTIKIKLPFNEEISIDDRKEKLLKWAFTMVRSKEIKVLEEKHLPIMSYLIVENPRR